MWRYLVHAKAIRQMERSALEAGLRALVISMAVNPSLLHSDSRLTYAAPASRASAVTSLSGTRGVPPIASHRVCAPTSTVTGQPRLAPAETPTWTNRFTTAYHTRWWGTGGCLHAPRRPPNMARHRTRKEAVHHPFQHTCHPEPGNDGAKDRDGGSRGSSDDDGTRHGTKVMNQCV